MPGDLIEMATTMRRLSNLVIQSVGTSHHPSSDGIVFPLLTHAADHVRRIKLFSIFFLRKQRNDEQQKTWVHSFCVRSVVVNGFTIFDLMTVRVIEGDQGGTKLWPKLEKSHRR